MKINGKRKRKKIFVFKDKNFDVLCNIYHSYNKSNL